MTSDRAEGRRHARRIRPAPAAGRRARLPALAAALVLAALLPQRGGAGSGGPLVLPSGLTARIHETVTSEPGGGLVYRFRFVAPGLASRGDDGFDTLMTDLEFLCNAYAIAHLPAIGPKPRQVIISLADRETRFGVRDPDAFQVFEAYSIEDGACIWEVF